MNMQTKRRIGTCIASVSLLMAVAIGGIWWRSLFSADEITHSTAIAVDGQYARRQWALLSGGGFVEIGRIIDVPINRVAAAKVRTLDDQTGRGWSGAFPVESIEGDRWEIFRDGLTRLSCYSTQEKHGVLNSSGRFLEVPYEVPLIAFLAAPAIAITRRQLRKRRLAASNGAFEPVVRERVKL